MLKLALIGEEVSKSHSKLIHTFLLEKLQNEKFSYDLISIDPVLFDERIIELISEYDGFNVTVPFKERVIRYLKGIYGAAEESGSVNTVKDGKGYSTDGEGFLLSLADSGIEVDGKEVLMLGAGGAARSLAVSLVAAGAKLKVYNRSYGNLLSMSGKIKGFEALESMPGIAFDIIINATSAGRDGGSNPVPLNLIEACGFAADIIYNPKETPFLRCAREQNKPGINGMGMLFFQAYLSDCIYLEREPDKTEAVSLFKQFNKEIKL